MKNYLTSSAIAFAMALAFASPQNASARPYGVFTNEDPTTNEPIATIVFYNDENESPDGLIINITDEGQIRGDEDRILMSQATKIIFQPSFYKFKPTNISGFFKDCTNLEQIINIECLDTRDVTNMSHLFNNCSNIRDLNLSSFDTENAEDMSYMFYGCNSLTNLDITSFFPTKVWNFKNMFDGCSMLTELDLSKFITAVEEEKNTLVCHPNCQNMVANCTNLKKLVLSPTLVFAITDGTGMNVINDEGETLNAFNNIGNAENPCRLYFPSCDVTFMLMGKAEEVWSDKYYTITNNIFNNIDDDGYNHWSGGIFVKGGFWGFDFYFGDEYELGDANHDYSFSVTDITKTVNFILKPDTEYDLFFINADMNKDGRISVSDIMSMVNQLLTGATVGPGISIGTGDGTEAGDCDAPLSTSSSDKSIKDMKKNDFMPENMTQAITTTATARQ